jgi:hypothetical protein
MTDAVADKLGVDRNWWEQALQARDRVLGAEGLAKVRAIFNNPPSPSPSKTELDTLKAEIERLKNLTSKEREVTKEPNWAEEMIPYLDLLNASTDEEALKIIHNAQTVKAMKEREKAIVKAFEVLGVDTLIITPFPTVEELEQKMETLQLQRLEDEIKQLKGLINACESYEEKIKTDLLMQVKRNYSNPQRIEEELNAQLSLYQPKFNSVKAALPYLKENLAIMEKIATKKRVEAIIPPEAIIKSHGEASGFKRLVNGIRKVANELS